MEHHSNYLPIKFLARKTGCNVRLVGMDSDGNLDIESYTKAIGTKSALVSITHASNVLGTINPAKELAKAAHEAGAVFVLDAAQSAPHLPIDVKKLDCDFMAFSGHKMLGPTGIGVLYGKKDLLDAIEPPLVGGGAVSKTCPGEIEFLESPHKFEAGTPNIAGAIGLSAAVDYLNKIGMKEVQKHEEALTKTALKGLSKIETYGPKNRVGVVSFNIDGVSAEDIAIILDENGIAIRSGHHCAQPLMCRLKVDGTARMSFYLYNTEEEVDFAIDVLNKIKKLG
jgi:cysteine desulfurase/selenocysteine lyase